MNPPSKRNAPDDLEPVDLYFEADAESIRQRPDARLIAILKAAKRKEERDRAARERPRKGGKSKKAF